MATHRLVAATANPHKLDEMAAILSGVVDLAPRPDSVPDVVEDEPTLVGNARKKARAIADATGSGALADDTGLEVDALDGAPGVYSARYAGDDASYDDNVAKLLRQLADVAPAERTARFRTVIVAAWPDGSEVIGEGVVEGHIARERSGEGGFGYDPVFVPDGADGLTFAQLSTDDKNAISHRRRALDDFLRHLE